MIFVNNSTTTQSGGVLTYKYLSANGQGAGSLNLSGSTWGASKAQIDYISISVASGDVTDFNVDFYEKDTFQAADIRYSTANIDASGWVDDLDWIYIDQDGSNEIHMKITENVGSGTYNIHIRGVELT